MVDDFPETDELPVLPSEQTAIPQDIAALEKLVEGEGPRADDIKAYLTGIQDTDPFFREETEAPTTQNLDDVNAKIEEVRALAVLPDEVDDRPQMIMGGSAKDPEEMEPTDRTAEGTEAAYTDTWDRDNPNTYSIGGATKTYDGVNLVVGAGCVYKEVGDETLYGYRRVLKIDSMGCIVTIGAETRYIVDVPTDP